MKRLFFLLALMPTFGFAKLGETAADAQARWGAPIKIIKEAWMIYDTPKYRIWQIYDNGGTGKCIYCQYFKKIVDEQIATWEAAQLDAVNTSPDTTWHVVKSGSPNYTAWANPDETLTIMFGSMVNPNNHERHYCRAFVTPEGAKTFIALDQTLHSSSAPRDPEKDATN